MRWSWWLAVASLLLVFGCARTQKPVLYPNAKLQQVGREQAERDIEACGLRERGYEVSWAGSDGHIKVAAGIDSSLCHAPEARVYTATAS